MPQILVRDLDQPLLDRLKACAKRHGRSLQAEMKAILESAAERHRALLVAERIRRSLKGRRFLDSADLLAEDRRR